MQWLIRIDESILFFINGFSHPAWLDRMMLAFSYNPAIVWMALGVLVLFFGRFKKPQFLIYLGASIVLSAVFVSMLLKPIIRRPRPDLSHSTQVVVVQEKPATIAFNNNFSFPSGHTTVAFAGAYVVARRMKKYACWFYLLAFLTAFSRIYLGKHYFLDVLFGGLIGAGVGWIVLSLKFSE